MFIIVKHAGYHWNWYWEEDPKITGANITHSVFDTYTGRSIGIQQSYFSKETADNDCERINNDNPSGDYAVCEVI